jgi:hypothetical protein
MKLFKLLLVVVLLFENSHSLAQDIIPIHPFSLTTTGDLEFLTDELPHYNYIFTGELHGAKVNIPIQQKFIHFLVTKNHLDGLFMESTFAQGYILQEYCNTNDETYFNALKTHLNPFEQKGNYIQFYKWLNEITKDMNRPLEIVGGDVILGSSIRPTIWLLNHLLGKDTLLSEQLTSYKFIKKLQKYPSNTIRFSAVKKLHYYLAKDIANHHVSLSKYLTSSELEAIKNMEYNLKQSLHKENFSTKKLPSLHKRERAIEDNFKRYISPEKKIFGQWGKIHVTFKSDENTVLDTSFVSFIQHLNEQEQYKQQFLLFPINCHPCMFETYSQPIYSSTPFNVDLLRLLLNEFKTTSILDFQKAMYLFEPIKTYAQYFIFCRELD